MEAYLFVETDKIHQLTKPDYKANKTSYPKWVIRLSPLPPPHSINLQIAYLFPTSRISSIFDGSSKSLYSSEFGLTEKWRTWTGPVLLLRFAALASLLTSSRVLWQKWIGKHFGSSVKGWLTRRRSTFNPHPPPPHLSPIRRAKIQTLNFLQSEGLIFFFWHL